MVIQAAAKDGAPRRIGPGWLHQFLVISYETVMQLIFALPRYPLFNALKSEFLRRLGARVGGGVVFYPGVRILRAPWHDLWIGNNVDLAYDVIVTGGVRIGDRTLVGFRSQILSENHDIPEDGSPIFSAGRVLRPISIEEDVWIGANCLILPGVTVGRGAVVAGGSVVTKSLPPFCVAAGVPARIIRFRSESELPSGPQTHAC